MQNQHGTKTWATICVRKLIDCNIAGPITTDQSALKKRPDMFMVNRNMKEAYLLNVAISNNHTITVKLQKYTDLKEETTRIWQLNAICVVLLALPTTSTIHKNHTTSWTAQSSSWSLCSDAENSNPESMSYSYTDFSIIMNKKRLKDYS
jgi:hypothetical protein